MVESGKPAEAVVVAALMWKLTCIIISWKVSPSQGGLDIVHKLVLV